MSSNNVIPASIMRQMGGLPKRDNREMVIDYLVSQEGSVVLTEKQQDLLKRWSFADDLMRSLRYTRKEVIYRLKQRFGYESATAERDLQDAAHVFGTGRKNNKPYLLALHIDRIEAAIVIYQKQGKDTSKLMDSMTKAIMALPEEKKVNDAPAALVFNFTQVNFNQLSDQPITEAQAKDIAIAHISKLGVEIEDIFAEEVEDD